MTSEAQFLSEMPDSVTCKGEVRLPLEREYSEVQQGVTMKESFGGSGASLGSKGHLKTRCCQFFPPHSTL